MSVAWDDGTLYITDRDGDRLEVERSAGDGFVSILSIGPGSVGLDREATISLIVEVMVALDIPRAAPGVAP